MTDWWQPLPAPRRPPAGDALPGALTIAERLRASAFEYDTMGVHCASWIGPEYLPRARTRYRGAVARERRGRTGCVRWSIHPVRSGRRRGRARQRGDRTRPASARCVHSERSICACRGGVAGHRTAASCRATGHARGTRELEPGPRRDGDGTPADIRCIVQRLRAFGDGGGTVGRVRRACRLPLRGAGRAAARGGRCGGLVRTRGRADATLRSRITGASRGHVAARARLFMQLSRQGVRSLPDRLRVRGGCRGGRPRRSASTHRWRTACCDAWSCAPARA